MKDRIRKIHKDDYPRVMEVWEASVRATHDFLKEEDLLYYKKVLSTGEAFDILDMLGLSDENGEIFGFMGSAEGKIEMLFIHPEKRGKGYGKLLIKEALENKGLTQVDVNKQNIQAVEFYKKRGFKVIDRSEKDGEGKEYPILHLSL